MGIVALIAAIIGGIGFWWWRAQQIKGAADSVIDAAGKARGMISRARFRQRSGQSVLAGVDNPGMAAATLLYSLMSLKRPLVLADEDKIDGMLETTCRMTKKDREDAMAFAAWASGQVADTSEIVRRDSSSAFTRSVSDWASCLIRSGVFSHASITRFKTVKNPLIPSRSPSRAGR